MPWDIRQGTLEPRAYAFTIPASAQGQGFDAFRIQG